MKKDKLVLDKAFRKGQFTKEYCKQKVDELKVKYGLTPPEDIEPPEEEMEEPIGEERAEEPEVVEELPPTPEEAEEAPPEEAEEVPLEEVEEIPEEEAPSEETEVVPPPPEDVEEEESIPQIEEAEEVAPPEDEIEEIPEEEPYDEQPPIEALANDLHPHVEEAIVDQLLEDVEEPPAWEPLPPKKQKKAQKQLTKYKKSLDKDFKKGKYTAEDCQDRIILMEIELGLAPPAVEAPPEEIIEAAPPPSEEAEAAPPPPEEVEGIPEEPLPEEEEVLAEDAPPPPDEAEDVPQPPEEAEEELPPPPEEIVEEEIPQIPEEEEIIEPEEVEEAPPPPEEVEAAPSPFEDVEDVPPDVEEAPPPEATYPATDEWDMGVVGGERDDTEPEPEETGPEEETWEPPPPPEEVEENDLPSLEEPSEEESPVEEAPPPLEEADEAAEIPEEESEEEVEEVIEEIEEEPLEEEVGYVPPPLEEVEELPPPEEEEIPEEVEEEPPEEVPLSDEEPPEEDERIVKLKLAYQEGRMSKEMYERNLTFFMGEAEEVPAEEPVEELSPEDEDVREYRTKEEGIANLLTVPGIGKYKATVLVEAGFRRVEELYEAGVEELSQIKHIGPKNARSIMASLEEMVQVEGTEILAELREEPAYEEEAEETHIPEVEDLKISKKLLIVGFILCIAGVIGVIGLRLGFIQHYLFGDPTPYPGIGYVEPSGHIVSIIPFVLGLVVIFVWGVRYDSIYYARERLKKEELEGEPEEDLAEELSEDEVIQPEEEPIAEEPVEELPEDAVIETGEEPAEPEEDAVVESAEELPPGLEEEMDDLEKALQEDQLADERTDYCEKMLAAALILPGDRERLHLLIPMGVSKEDFTEEIRKAVNKRKEEEFAPEDEDDESLMQDLNGLEGFDEDVDDETEEPEDF